MAEVLNKPTKIGGAVAEVSILISEGMAEVSSVMAVIEVEKISLNFKFAFL